MCRTSFHVCCYGSPHQGGPYQSRTVHSSDFFGLDCFAFVLLCRVIFCFGGIKPPWGGFITPKGVVLTRGVVLSPIRGGFIPHKGWLYPPKGVVLSPKKGGFIPHKSGHKTTQGGFKGGFIPHLGVVLCPGPLWGDGISEDGPNSQLVSGVQQSTHTMNGRGPGARCITAGMGLDLGLF